MDFSRKRFTLTLLILPLLLTLFSQPGYGVWTTILNEHFDNDQRVPVQRFPWNTPFQNPNVRWYYNPMNPYYRASGDHRSFSSWGWQDLIFNTNVVARADFPGAIWCAYTNGTNVDNPRWPEDDDYMLGQRAWAWWGPMDLRNAVSASVSWWMNIDLENFSSDSLSVVVFNDPDLATIPANRSYNQANFRTNQPFGAMRDPDGEFAGISSFNSTTGDWVQRSFNLNDLRILNAGGDVTDSVSYLGQRNIYIAFVWNTDSIGIVGKGAFVDDVVIGMDNGLFDLRVDSLRYGYQDGEGTFWSPTPPGYLEPTKFRMLWRADGPGETPAFRITCTLNGEEIFAEERQIVAGVDSTYISETSDYWIAIPDTHVVVWTIDPGDNGGAVRESDEGNNIGTSTFEVPWTPPPVMEWEQPEQDIIGVPINIPIELTVAISDSNEGDNSLTGYLFFTRDTTGLAADPLHIFDFTPITFRFDLPQGDWIFSWNLEEAVAAGALSVDDTIFVAGFVSDGIPNNFDVKVFGARIAVLPPASVRQHLELAETPFLMRAFPNPFNSEIKIDYSISSPGEVRLTVFDLAGRAVATIVEGRMEVGSYIVSWKPAGLGAGVYLIRLNTGTNIALQKVVYTP
jgi:hypothetical protein